MAKYNIGGYIFEDENKARKAAKELKTVEYILGQLKDADESGVLTVYKKLLKQRLFSTEIGMSFLSQLRQNLLSSGAFSENDIPDVYKLEDSTEKNLPDEPIETSKESNVEAVENNSKTKTKNAKAKKEKADKKNSVVDSDVLSQLNNLKVINKLLAILCLTLLLCVIGMFYVNSTINSPTILNYEEKLLDKYSSWEQELSEREAAVKEKELEQQ